MTEVDNELINKKLADLRDYLHKLEEFIPMDKKTFTADHHHYGLAEHYLQAAIEAVLDVCRHLVVARELSMPDDAHGLFSLLVKQKVLTNTFAGRNEKMPGFRNRLVHSYSEIDHEKTFAYLQEHLPDFQVFISQVSRFLINQEQ